MEDQERIAWELLLHLFSHGNEKKLQNARIFSPAEDPFVEKCDPQNKDTGKLINISVAIVLSFIDFQGLLLFLGWEINGCVFSLFKWNLTIYKKEFGLLAYPYIL
jgi:hypothetical protein